MIEFEYFLARAAVERFTDREEREQLIDSMRKVNAGEMDPDSLIDFNSFLGIAWWGVVLTAFTFGAIAYVITDSLSPESVAAAVGRFAFSLTSGITLFQLVITARRQMGEAGRRGSFRLAKFRIALLPSWLDLMVIVALCVPMFYINPFAAG
ncbi:hypothetical protein [Streptomyces sp. SID12501]|uniref:Uncharacterized protein n=1 Tax=Streptomyces sp. SID12501 TaxID=2706042 RepID=A0A6B3BYF8_9ACTN|nr:hypothetical protein [Streptomyces sp. SID12501]NEC89352.1 hypothetical protein [Streptomyces sp. SID12501]